MDFINITDQFFFAVMISTITGTFMLVVWLLFHRLLLRINPMLAYILLRWISLLYLIPFGYFAVLPYYREWIQGDDGIWRLLFAHTDGLVVIMRRFGMVWFCIVCILIIYRLIETKKCNYKLSDNIPMCDRQPRVVFGEICKELGIESSSLTLKKNVLFGIPMIHNAVHPEIVFPEGNFTREQLQCFLHHELSHYQHRDLWGKCLAVILTILHCFNPAIYLHLYLIDMWSEYLADLSAIKRVYSKVNINTIKRYYELILDIIPSEDDSKERGRKERKFKFILSVLFESTKSFKKRIDFMKGYKKFGQRGKVSIVCLSIILMLLTTVTAFAAGNLVKDAHGDYYQNTEDVFYEGRVIAEDGMVEYYCNIEDLDMESLKIVKETQPGCSLYVPGSFSNQDWQVNSNTRHIVGNFIVKAGGLISLSAACNPVHSQYLLGIVDDDGYARYVVENDAIFHGFKITSDKHYWIFVQNNNKDVDLSVAFSIHIDK